MQKLPLLFFLLFISVFCNNLRYRSWTARCSSWRLTNSFITVTVVFQLTKLITDVICILMSVSLCSNGLFCVRLSVCLSRQHTDRDTPEGSMRCGQRKFRPDNNEDRHPCWRLFSMWICVSQFAGSSSVLLLYLFQTWALTGHKWHGFCHSCQRGSDVLKQWWWSLVKIYFLVPRSCLKIWGPCFLWGPIATRWPRAELRTFDTDSFSQSLCQNSQRPHTMAYVQCKQ